MALQSELGISGSGRATVPQFPVFVDLDFVVFPTTTATPLPQNTYHVFYIGVSCLVRLSVPSLLDLE